MVSEAAIRSNLHNWNIWRERERERQKEEEEERRKKKKEKAEEERGERRRKIRKEGGGEGGREEGRREAGDKRDGGKRRKCKQKQISSWLLACVFAFLTPNRVFALKYSKKYETFNLLDWGNLCICHTDGVRCVSLGMNFFSVKLLWPGEEKLDSAALDWSCYFIPCNVSTC